ncbi:MAG TPA: carotenoid oxygenase family protein [Solirubrobacteraceae bacterium]|jgi:beta,beta-carotene 9',10'-dioxygenase|nr:carotenoid oxygenase family protein [Solirubrobacteraceae bacterium]
MSVAATPSTSTGPALGFTTLEREVTVDELALSGELPTWLRGSLLRTGPAKFEVGVGAQRMRHWFDGLAMLHRFTIDDGRVSYGNRFLEGRSYRAVREQGKIAYSEFATDPCRSLFKRVQTLFSPGEILSDNANVNIARLGERFVAMTETPLPLQFDEHTLQTADVRPFSVPGQLTTAHPHLDRANGDMLNYAAKLGARNSYRFFSLAPPHGSQQQAEPRLIASLPVKQPAYMHSFGLTENWLVLAEFPYVVNPLALALSGRPYIENYRWKPELGTRFTLVDRISGESVGGFHTDACFAFHHVNAYDDDGEVVVDLCALPDAGIVQDLYLERLRAGKPAPVAKLTRFRLSLGDRSVTREQLSDEDLELPRINYARCNERHYRYVWGVGNGPGGWLERIVRIDTAERSSMSWSQPGCYPGEPVFVARPAASPEDKVRDEDDGVLLSVVLDADAGRSFLLVLDARDLSELARAEAPHHIPFGFHGQFARLSGTSTDADR